MNTFDEDRVQHLLERARGLVMFVFGLGLVGLIIFVGKELAQEFPQVNPVGALAAFALIGVALLKVHSKSSHS